MISDDRVAPARGRLSVARKYAWKYGYGYLFVLPVLAFYTVWVIYPFISSIGLSLTDWDGAQPVRQFIGLANYKELLQDDKLYISLRHNLIWMILIVIVPNAIALVLAVLVWSSRGRILVVFRTVYFLPQIMPVVIIGFIWQWIYNPSFGILNRILETVGLDSLTRGWLGDFGLALFAVLVAAMWASIGFDFVIYLAGLQNVDIELLDSAKLDGANALQNFWHVLVPQLANVVTLLTVLRLINALKVFDIIFIMTGGGPGTATEVLTTHIYEQAFRWNRVGYGTALATVLTVLALITSVIFIYVRERGELDA